MLAINESECMRCGWARIWRECWSAGKKIKENDGNGLALSKWFVAGKCKFVSGIDVFRKSARLRVYKVDEEKKRKEKRQHLNYATRWDDRDLLNVWSTLYGFLHLVH